MKQDNSNKYIEGEKVYLRPYQSEQDIEALYQANFQKESNRFTGNTRPFSKKVIEQYVDNIMAGSDDRVDFVIVSQDDDEPVGEIVLNEIEDRKANLRIALFHKNYFNKGYGTEAIRLMLDYG